MGRWEDGKMEERLLKNNSLPAYTKKKKCTQRKVRVWTSWTSNRLCEESSCLLSWFTPTITAKAAVEKIRNMTHGDECGITLALERVRSVQPLAFIWAHFLRLYLTCCSLRYGVSSARIRIGFPADILQETAVHQSRGSLERDWVQNIPIKKGERTFLLDCLQDNPHITKKSCGTPTNRITTAWCKLNVWQRKRNVSRKFKKKRTVTKQKMKFELFAVMVYPNDNCQSGCRKD